MVATGSLTRLHRSELTVPGSNRHMLERAPDLGADVVMLDLEDSVAPPEKELARAQVIHALTELDWSGSSVSLRINGLDTPWCYRDLVDIVERAGEALDTITVPKVGRPSDVELVCTLLAQIEQAMGIARPIGVSVLIETAEGMACVEQIASTCPDRLEAMIFGVADYAASLHSLTGTKGGPDAGYAVPTDPDDEGKWAIHPSQIPLANEVFTPRRSLIEQTHRIMAAMKSADAEGRGAVSLDGKLIDSASIRMAENLLAKLEQIEGRDGVTRAVPKPG
jgi:malyl-CoA/(S)-citramalyl-CoA lyase